MQAKKRYLLLFACCAFLAYWYFGGFRWERTQQELVQLNMHILPSYLNGLDDYATGSISRPRSNPRIQACTMEKCFDFSRCMSKFTVYVYPPDENDPKPSVSYQKLLNVITQSRYYTKDPQNACLFVVSLDTLDRDRLSADYVRNLQSKIDKLPYWNNGLNHIIFNLYSGTWPNYTEDQLDFDYGMAILAKASMSDNHLRRGFDISIPLFHKQHPERGETFTLAPANGFPMVKEYVLAFKGKRYVYGIGSETRNTLHLLHNGRDVIMVTTCKHGKNWKEMKDERCDQDNAEYDKYDYMLLLQNSTFCIVARGRRLGSFRFLEALQAGCIPVILSNGWVLPFSQFIDWRKAVIWADERIVLQVPSIVRSISQERILKLRQHIYLFWSRYLSSVENIVATTLEVIRDRLPGIKQPNTRHGAYWNTHPGALVTLTSYTDHMASLPFHLHQISLNSLLQNYTAVIYCYSDYATLTVTHHPIHRLLDNLSQSRSIHKVILLLANQTTVPELRRKRWNNRYKMQVSFVTPTNESVATLGRGISLRFYPYDEIETDAILSLDEDSSLITEEMDFGFRVWREFPDRIVGYPARSHYWDENKATWSYTSKWTNEYSIILTSAAFYHRYYNALYAEWLSPMLKETVQKNQNCEDILMNFLVSHVTKLPPIKLAQRRHFKQEHSQMVMVSGGGGGGSGSGSLVFRNDPDRFLQRQTCLKTFVTLFGYMPLIRSSLRLDPTLFKDPVSNKRKKYTRLELVGS